MGEEGCGSSNTTRFLLICLQCLKFGVLCDLENVFKATWRMVMKKGEKKTFLGAYIFDFLPAFPLNLSRKEKNQRAIFLQNDGLNNTIHLVLKQDRNFLLLQVLTRSK